MLVPQKPVVKPQSRDNRNKFFLQILRVEDLPGDVTLKIYFASCFFLAYVYANEHLKLVQEEFYCACSSKARGKAAKSRL